MTQATAPAALSLAALRTMVTTAISNALSHPEILNFRRKSAELPKDALWRRRERIAELAVDEVVGLGVEHDIASRIVPKVFEAICAGQETGRAAQQLVVI